MKILKRLKQIFTTPFKPKTTQYIYTQHFTEEEAEALFKQMDEAFEEFDKNMSKFMDNLSQVLKDRNDNKK